MKPNVDVRVVRKHAKDCDGRWKWNTKWTHVTGGDGEFGDLIVTSYGDRLARLNNGGRLYWEMCCTAAYRCDARALVYKGYVGNVVREMLG